MPGTKVFVNWSMAFEESIITSSNITTFDCIQLYTPPHTHTTFCILKKHKNMVTVTVSDIRSRFYSFSFLTLYRPPSSSQRKSPLIFLFPFSQPPCSIILPLQSSSYFLPHSSSFLDDLVSVLSPDCILTSKDSELGFTDKRVLVTFVKHISKAYTS